MNNQPLDEGDTLALLRLNNQLHELPANPVVRHERMLKELCDLTGASAGVSALLDAPPSEPVSVLFLVSHGIDHAQQQSAIHRYLRALDMPLGGPASLTRLLESRAWETPRSQSAIQENDAISESLLHARELCRPLGLGSAIFSSFALRPQRLVSLLSLHQPLQPSNGDADARPGFTARQRRLVEVFHSQIGWTFRAPLPAQPGAAARLSPRQQQTLRHLLAGENEKQIAMRLSRSRHTVHSYVKAIYRNFRVSSRGELLSLFVR